MSTTPEMVKVKARDVRPHHYAVWCTFEGSPDKPVSNEIELVRWSHDGTKVTMLLSSHNVLSEDPDTVLELIPLKPDAYYVKKYGPGVWALGPQPKQPEDPREDELVRLRRQLSEARAEVERLRRSLSSAERVSVVRQRDADLSFTLKWLRMQPCETSETLADDMPVPPLVTD